MQNEDRNTVAIRMLPSTQDTEHPKEASEKNSGFGGVESLRDASHFAPL